MDNAKYFSLGHLGDFIYGGGEHWERIGLGENQDFGLRYFAFEMLTRTACGDAEPHLYLFYDRCAIYNIQQLLKN